eukprot:COSAG06_NODE_6568_length_2878_cov_1.067290_1_plen_246_part_10
MEEKKTCEPEPEPEPEFRGGATSPSAASPASAADARAERAAKAHLCPLASSGDVSEREVDAAVRIITGDAAPAGRADGKVCCRNGWQCYYIRFPNKAHMDQFYHPEVDEDVERPPGCPEWAQPCKDGAKCHMLKTATWTSSKEHLQMFWHPGYDEQTRPPGCPEGMTPCKDGDKCRHAKTYKSDNYQGYPASYPFVTEHMQEYWHPSDAVTEPETEPERPAGCPEWVTPCKEGADCIWMKGGGSEF